MNNTTKPDQRSTNNESTTKPKDTTPKALSQNSQKDLQQALNMPDMRPSQFQGHIGI